MKIVRSINGENFEFELTEGELYQAYLEEERNRDCEDVVSNWDPDWYADRVPDDRYGEMRMLVEDHEFVEDVAKHYRERLDNDDHWYTTLQKTIADAVEDWIMEGE